MYEKIDINKFPFGVTTEFKVSKLPDNSVLLIRYENVKAREPEITLRNTYFGGDKDYVLRVPENKPEVDAVVIICRTSINHYVITGSTAKHTQIGHGKTVTEVASFIKRWFCRTLIKD